MWNRCSFQEGKENNCWFEQSSEKSTVSTVPLFLGHPVYNGKGQKILGVLVLQKDLTAK